MKIKNFLCLCLHIYYMYMYIVYIKEMDNAQHKIFIRMNPLQICFLTEQKA